jgi:hypothetical protein
VTGLAGSSASVALGRSAAQPRFRPSRDRDQTAAQFIGLRMSLKPIDYMRWRHDHPGRPMIRPSRGSALSPEGLSISLPKRLDGRSVRMLCAVAVRQLFSVGDRAHIDGSATEARCLIADIEERCRGAIVR